MKTGVLSQVIRNIEAKDFPSIELSMNTFLNRNNYLGLIHAEPDPQSFFNIEKTHTYHPINEQDAFEIF